MINRTTLVILGLALATHNTAFAEETPPPAEQPAQTAPETAPETSPQTGSPENSAEASATDAPATNANPTEAAQEGASTEGSSTGDATAPAEDAAEGATAQEAPLTPTPAATPASTPEPKAPIQEASDSSEGHGGGHSAFTVEEMWEQSSGPVRSVLLMLLIMLIGSMGVAIERFFYLGAAKRQSLALAGEVGSLLKAGNPEKALELSKEARFEKSYFAHQVSASLAEYTQFKNHFGIEATERAIEKHTVSEGPLLRKGFNILATTGSTAPFVGLVGTIFGIINAFGQIGAEGGADLTTLAPAIGEALITTAFGIIVAIVGVWLFNYFTAVIDGITNDMSVSAQEILDWCHKAVESQDHAAK